MTLNREASFNISLPTLVICLASLLGAAVTFGSLASQVKLLQDKSDRHQILLQQLTTDLSRVTAIVEGTNKKVDRLDEKFDKLK